MRCLGKLGAVLLVTFCSLAASAAPPASATDREAARPYAEKGFELYQAGDCKGAREMFKTAEQKFHAPPHLLFIARCNAKLGSLLEARDGYRLLIDDKIAPDAPQPFRDAQASARGELDEIEIRLPTLEIAVTGSGAASAQVTVDGKPFPASDFGKPTQLNPGVHKVRAVGTDPAAPFERAVTLKDGGGNEKVPIVFDAVVAADTSRPTLLPALVAFGVGAVGVGVGAATGAASLGKVNELFDKCGNKRCAPSLKGTGDSATTLGTVSTIAFIAGGVGVAAGVTLLVWHPPFLGGAQPQQQGSRAPRVEFGLGLGSARLSGSF